MGSDLYIESHSFRPGPNIIYWDEDELVIEKEFFYDGYREVFRGVVADTEDATIQQLVKGLCGLPIPPRPPAHSLATIKTLTRKQITEADLIVTTRGEVLKLRFGSADNYTHPKRIHILKDEDFN